jgi:hypothetical protein
MASAPFDKYERAGGNEEGLLMKENGGWRGVVAAAADMIHNLVGCCVLVDVCFHVCILGAALLLRLQQEEKEAGGLVGVLACV